MRQSTVAADLLGVVALLILLGCSEEDPQFRDPSAAHGPSGPRGAQGGNGMGGAGGFAEDGAAHDGQGSADGGGDGGEEERGGSFGGTSDVTSGSGGADASGSGGTLGEDGGASGSENGGANGGNDDGGAGGGSNVGGAGGGCPNPAGCLDPEVREGCEGVTHDGHLYALCRDKMVPFPEARADCEAMNMQLIRVDSASEDAWIYQTFFEGDLSENQDNYQMWLGGTDNGVEGEWRWLAGDDLFWQGADDGMPAFGLYTNWGRPYGEGPPDQPNDSHSAEGEDCMVIRGPLSSQVVKGTWIDVGCGAENNPPDMDNRKGWYTCESW